MKNKDNTLFPIKYLKDNIRYHFRKRIKIFVCTIFNKKDLSYCIHKHKFHQGNQHDPWKRIIFFFKKYLKKDKSRYSLCDILHFMPHKFLKFIMLLNCILLIFLHIIFLSFSGYHGDNIRYISYSVWQVMNQFRIWL